MGNNAKPSRINSCIFKEDDIKFFYKNILLVVESDGKVSYGKKEILKDSAKMINTGYIYDFEYENYQKKLINPVQNVFYFSAESSVNSSKRKYSDIVRRWFKHLRNAFAHNFIILDKGIYHFYDFHEGNAKSTKQTLYAQITSLDDFKKLVLEVKSKINYK